MSFLRPTLPPYDALEWERLPFGERSKQVCRAWALQGYGTPLAIYIVYALKIVFYIGGWIFFCSFTPSLGEISSIGSWWLDPVAFQKAILWSMLFEGLGLGCGSGPLTARYVPPVGGFLHFLRPGTTKMPFFRDMPILGGSRRTPLDALLYAAALGLLLAALLSATIPVGLFVAIAAVVVALGVADKTIFLAMRSEHYWTAIVVLAIAATPEEWIPGAKAIWLALWFWAGFSKLNHHFPTVVAVMNSNHPLTRFAWMRKPFYRNFPDDLAPSRLAVIAHGGTTLEFAVPIVLFLGDGGTVTTVGLVLMVFLHAFITSNVPMGVPLEWNFMMVYGGFFLFYEHASTSIFSMPPEVGAFLIVMLVAIPLLGNLVPSRVSFLMSMRFYAGNWPWSIWLFEGDSHRKLEQLTKSSAWVYDQLERIYDRPSAVAMVGKVMGFRLMHLHGRSLQTLVPKAIGDRLPEYQWVDGELIAGMVLGWNFGDGHLHDERLLRSVQEQCGFEEGELRCIFVEGQPVGRHTLHYRIADAATGQIEEGEIDVRELRRRQPWPRTTGSTAPAAEAV